MQKSVRRVLLFFGQFSEAFVSAGAVLFNAVISVIQEVHAKRSLDRIALLTRPKATAGYEVR